MGSRTKTLLLSIFLIASCLIFTSGCAPKIKEVPVYHTEYVFFIPDKIVTPTKPELQAYDNSKYLNESPNFERLQKNTLMLKNYSNALRKTVDQYEELIDNMKAQKQIIDEGGSLGTTTQ